MNSNAVILAGGFGSRLKPVIGTKIPKPMAIINGKPLLEQQIELCSAYGFKNIVILLHHLPDVVKEYFKDGSKWGVNLNYVIEKLPRGTAGAIRDALPLLTDQFLIIYGDTYLDIDLKAFWKSKMEGDALLTFAHPNSHPYDSDLLVLDQDDVVVDVFRPKKNELEMYDNIVNAALYVADGSVFNNHVPLYGEMDISSELFPKMIESKDIIRAYKSVEYIRDMGTPERYLRVKSDISKSIPQKLSLSSKKKCVFLDRDGVINFDDGHLNNIKEFRLINGVEKLIKKLNDEGYLVICVTNQPVIARGDLSINGLNEIHKYLQVLLGIKGAYLDDIFYCPHHPDSGFPGEVKELKIKCQCRKPEPGMILDAILKYNIDIEESWMIGDHMRDIRAGEAAGIKTILFGSNGQNHISEDLPSYHALTHDDVIEIICSKNTPIL